MRIALDWEMHQNDIGFLQVVQRAVIIPSPHLESMRTSPTLAMIADGEGPVGWNRAIFGLLPAHLSGKVPQSRD